MTLNDVEVLWIDAVTGEVHTPEITITRKMNVLGYVDEMDDEGRINTRWAGGE
jgi:cytoskeletal protein CcmA (bactofilin family)